MKTFVRILLSDRWEKKANARLAAREKALSQAILAGKNPSMIPFRIEAKFWLAGFKARTLLFGCLAKIAFAKWVMVEMVRRLLELVRRWFLP